MPRQSDEPLHKACGHSGIAAEFQYGEPFAQSPCPGAQGTHAVEYINAVAAVGAGIISTGQIGCAHAAPGKSVGEHIAFACPAGLKLRFGDIAAYRTSRMEYFHTCNNRPKGDFL